MVKSPFSHFFLLIGDPKNGHPHRKIASLGPDPLPPVDSVFYFRILGKAEKYSATGLAVSASAGGQCVKKRDVNGCCIYSEWNFNVLQATINGDTMEYITSLFWIELDLRFVDDS